MACMPNGDGRPFCQDLPRANTCSAVIHSAPDRQVAIPSKFRHQRSLCSCSHPHSPLTQQAGLPSLHTHIVLRAGTHVTVAKTSREWGKKESDRETAGEGDRQRHSNSCVARGRMV